MIKYLLILILLSGCYTLPKATRQFGRATATYPVIGADYCARVYPAKDSLIQGDSVINTDTIIYAGDTYIDTLIEKDTVRITKVVQLPGREITRTILRVDTVRVVNTAAVDLCRIEAGKVVAALEKEQARADKYQGRSKTYLYIIIGLALAAIVWTYFKLKKK